jgi:hypothetical protein
LRAAPAGSAGGALGSTGASTDRVNHVLGADVNSG